MKKYFKQCTALLLLCVFMTTFLFAGPYNVVLADSLLNNGGFESGMWPLKTGGSIDTVVKHSGNQSAKLVAGTNYQYIGTDLIPVNRSDMYELSVWIKTANISTPDGVSVNVLLYNSSGTYRGYNEPAKLIKTGGTQDWTQYTVDVGNFAANDTTSIKIYLKVDGSITGTVWFDDVVLQKKVTDNMIANPGFEAGWPLSQGGNYDTAVKHSGNQSAKLVGTTADQYLGTGLIPVNPNGKYTLSAWIKTSGVSKSDGVYLNALMADANGRSLGVCTPAKLIKTGGTQDWTQYTVDVGNFAAGTAFIRVYARLDANITGTAWFDDVELYTAGIYGNAVVNIIGEPSNIMDVSNAGFDITLNTAGNQNIACTFEYSLDDKSFTDTITAEPGKDTVKSIRFTDHQKGVFDLKVSIKNGDRVIKTVNTKIGIVEYYKPQYMDSYNREVMSTHLAFSQNSTDQTDLNIMNKIGVVAIRDEIYWGSVEPQKGVWDFSKSDTYMKWLEDAGIKAYIVTDFSNSNYVTPPPGVTDKSKCPPRTKAELDAFCEYVKQILTRYKNIVAIEVWNEANWKAFWQPTPNVIDYATMVKAVSLTAREVRPDVQIMAGSLVYLNGTDYFYDLFGENLFPYIDGISSHPYYFPQSVDSALPKTLQTGIDVFNSFGGFKDNYASEVGLPTSNNMYGISEQGQAEALIKTYIYDDSRGLAETTWYDFRNDGTSPSNNEHNFGVINKDYSPKIALAALSQFNNRLNGSVYQGEVNIGSGLQAHLYTKDGSPMLVAWNMNAGTATVNIPNSKVEDMYGNVLQQSDVVNLDSSPKYIFGVPLNYYAKAVSYSVNKAYVNFLNKWSSIYTNQTALTELKNTAMSLTDLPSAADALNLMQKNYSIGTDIINLAKNNSINVTDQQLMSMLNDINGAGILWANLYAAAAGNEKIAVTISSDALNAADQKVKDKISVENFASMYISQEILRHAARYNQRANEINIMAENPGKGQAVAFNNIMSSMLAGWVSQIADFEKVNLNTGVLLYADPSNATIYQGKSGNVNFTVDNRKRNDLTNVVAVVKDENGQEVFTSNSFNVPSSSSTSLDLNIPVSSTKVSGRYKYSITIKDSSGEITKQSIFVNIQSTVNATVLPATAPISEMNQLNIKVDNNYSEALSLQVEVKGPEGWSFKKDVLPVVIDTKSSLVVPFDIDQLKKVPFNTYAFEISVKDQDGNLLQRQKLPLDIPIAVINNSSIAPKDFSGDVTSWEDAYPVFVNPPKDPDNPNAWLTSNVAAKLYAKWDDQYFYFLADVNDDTQIQNYHNSLIWQGDSIQVTLDTNGDKATSYKPDDYELGLALTGTGEEVYAYFFGSQPYGQRPPEWTRIIRDNQQKLTRYYGRIPMSALNNWKPAAGGKFGFNMAINDADLVDRDSQVYLRPGTGSPQNPSGYETWTFWNNEVLLNKVTLNASKTVVKPGESVTLAVYGSMSDSSPADLSQARIVYTTDNEQIAKVDSSGTVTATGEGIANVKASVTFNGITVEGSIQIMVDNTPPATAALIDGTGKNGWYSTDATVTLSATDNLSGVDRTEYRIGDSGDWITYTGPFALTQEGTYILQYRSTDKAGNVEDIKQQTIQIDKTPPATLAGYDKQDRNGWYNSDVTVTLSAYDSLSGVAYTEYTIGDSSNFVTYTQPLKFTDEGIYNVQYRSVDIAGNKENIRQTTVHIDKTAPVTTAVIDKTAKNGWYNSDINVTLVGTDNLSGVDKTEYRIGTDGNWNIYTGPVVMSQEGTYTIQYRSTDKAGNVEDIKQQTVQIDKTPPEFNLVVNGNVLNDGGTFDDYLPLTLKVWDNLSGVASAQITVGGSVYAVDLKTQPSIDIDLAGKVGSYTVTITAEDIAGNKLEKNFTFTVTTSIDSMRHLIDRYVKSGELGGPLVDQLTNNLNQAQHQLDIGRPEQAAKHMEDFIKHLNNDALGNNVKDYVKTILNADAEALIKLWSGI